MKWKGLYHVAKSPHHVATRTAGKDSDSASSSGGLGGVRGAVQPQIRNFSCHHMGWSDAAHTHTHTHTHTVCKPTPPNSTACQQSPHTSAHFAFFILYNYSSNTPKGKVTHVRTHISSSTWLNVTVGHVLICWRYRVNDGHVVTFTQARESMQPLPGAEGDGKPWYVYGKTLSCPFIMEMWRSRLASPGVSPFGRAPFCDGTSVSVCACLCVLRHAYKCKAGSAARASFFLSHVQAELLDFSSCQLLLPSFYMFSWNPPPDGNQLPSWLTGKQLQQTLHYSPLAPASPLQSPHFFSLSHTLSISYTLSLCPSPPRSPGCWQAILSEPKFKTQPCLGMPTGIAGVPRKGFGAVLGGAREKCVSGVIDVMCCIFLIIPHSARTSERWLGGCASFLNACALPCLFSGGSSDDLLRSLL